jgi:UPF0755 protein
VPTADAGPNDAAPGRSAPRRTRGTGRDRRRPDPAPPEDWETAVIEDAAYDEDDTVPIPVLRPGEGRRRADRRADQRAGRRRARRGRGVVAVVLLVLLGAVGGGGYYLYDTYFLVSDYEGEGSGDVVVQVQDGQTTTQIGNALTRSGVVAEAEAFTRAAAEDDRVRSVQPGYYRLRSRMSGAAAVALLLDPASRVGQLEIRGGVQLDDTRGPDGSVAPGVLTLVSEATCAELDGERRCVSVDELRAAMAETPPAELGVPEWALEGAEAAEPRRRLEGLLAPGRYDVQPGVPAVEVLRGLLAASAPRLEASGLVSGAQAIGFSPYETLVIASLVEKEAITPDMPRVARVVYNRLGVGQRLELDSTVNYPLDLQALATTDADREAPGPYNSYTTVGLPPTPIAAAGVEAIDAALEPEPGPWFFFVRCETDGASCFAETFEEHQANVVRARANGAF